MKKRVVVFGAAGFVGSHIIKNLNPELYQVIPLSRQECDLADKNCRAVIEKVVKDRDIVVCAAAKAPAKNLEMLAENVSMISHIAEAVKHKRLSYLLNISSDAIYADAPDKINESSTIAPLNAHGIMHCMREVILEKSLAPVGHLRPTLIYGKDDPHNGYGPNSFIRLAREGRNIELFGQGEEQRDHIYVGDVARLAIAMITQKTQGAVNAVTGKTISFMEIAELAAEATGGKIHITSKPRLGPMPHNGYRAFNNARARSVCPNLQFQDIGAYIGAMVKETV